MYYMPGGLGGSKVWGVAFRAFFLLSSGCFLLGEGVGVWGRGCFEGLCRMLLKASFEGSFCPSAKTSIAARFGW